MDAILKAMNEVKSYKMLAPGYRQRLRAAIEKLDIKKGDIVLEVGCGGGEQSEILSRLGAVVTSIDISEKEIEMAKKRVGNGVDFIVCDAENLPFRDNSFDKVLSVSLLEHLPNDYRSVSEMNRVLRKDGIGVIVVPSRDIPFFRDPINYVNRKIGREPFRKLGGWAWDHFRDYTNDDIVKLLEKNNLEILEIEKTEHSIVSACHFYFPEIYTFMVRPLLSKKSSKIKRNSYGSLFSNLSKISEKISNADRKLNGSHCEFCIKFKKVDK